MLPLSRPRKQLYRKHFPHHRKRLLHHYSLKNEGSDEPSYEVYFLEKEELPEKEYFYERNKVYDEEKAEKISFLDGI